VYYFEELCRWIDTQGFNMVYVNMLHDPSHMNISHMRDTAKQLVIDKLRAGMFHPKYRNDVEGIVRFIQNGQSTDGTEFCNFMKRTDANRNENFAETHPEIAEAMGYGQT
jgi:hypothetical protein